VYILLRRIISTKLTLYIREVLTPWRSARYFLTLVREMDLQHSRTNFLQYTTLLSLFRDKSKKLLLTSNFHLMWFICIFRYLSNKDLELAPTKFKWILFSNRKHSIKEDFTFKIFINNHLVERILNVRFLSVILDCWLKGEDYFKQIIKKRKSLINVLSSLVAVWGSPQLLFIYRTVFRGSIEWLPNTKWLKSL